MTDKWPERTSSEPPAVIRRAFENDGRSDGKAAVEGLGVTSAPASSKSAARRKPAKRKAPITAGAAAPDRLFRPRLYLAYHPRPLGAGKAEGMCGV